MDKFFHAILPGDRIREESSQLKTVDSSFDPHLARVHLELEMMFRSNPEFRRQHAELLAMQEAAA